MSREIKFRAWVKPEYEDEMKMEYDVVIEGNNTILDFDDCLVSGGVEHRRGKVMQYTGLKDKNGKEIYEGDVLKIINDNYKVNGKIVADTVPYYLAPISWDSAVVKWLPTRGCYIAELSEPGARMVLIPPTKFIEGEVIGNIYENNDLMGAELNE